MHPDTDAGRSSVADGRSRRFTVPDGLPSARVSALVLLLAASALFVAVGSGTHQDPATFDWWDTAWRHRVGVEVGTNTDMEWWPIERRYNFTKLLRSQNNTGDFDNASIRVIEYFDNGTVRREVPSQFDEADTYNKSTNAVGTLIWQLRGRTPSGTNTSYFVYFESEDNGKPAPTYNAPQFTDTVTSERVLVNTSKNNYTIRRDAKDNTTGIFEVFQQDLGTTTLQAAAGERPAEYTEFRNGTHTFTFNLTQNISVTRGPIRTTVTFRGYREVFNAPDGANDLLLEKQYHFYNLSGENTSAFVKIDQNITNTAGSGVTFRSTQSGAVAVDVNRTMGGSKPFTEAITNETDPFSQAGARGADNNYFTGVMNLNESVPNFLAVFNVYKAGRVGANMTETTVAAGSSISHRTFLSPQIQFGNPGSEFQNLQTMFRNQPDISRYEAETFDANVTGVTNATLFNRDEAVQLLGNVTDDTFNVTRSVNATLSFNTSTTGDDINISLTRNASQPWDTDTQWTGLHRLNNSSTLGRWTLNVTAYTKEKNIVDKDRRTFTVTDRYASNLTIRNPVEVAGLPIYANITVRNAREDTNITGANISCTYDGSSVHPDNITAFSPGVYALNFTAPSPPSSYTLDCNATRSGNLGQDSEPFRTEVATVVPNVTFQPRSSIVPNITVADSVNVSFRTNVSNQENGTMSSTNVTFFPPSGWSTNRSNASCGDLAPDSFCTLQNLVTVPNGTAPGNYTVNATTEWVNPDESFNQTNDSFPVEVEANPVLNVSAKNVSGRVGGGQNVSIGTYPVDSLGNVNLTNVSSVCASGGVCTSFSATFVPQNISSIRPTNSSTVEVFVDVPIGVQPGLYNGTVNVSAVDTFDTISINVTVIAKTTVTTSTVPANTVTADNVTLSGNQTVDFAVNASNIGEAIANSTNASIVPPAAWSTNLSQQECGDLDVNGFCERDFFVTVPNGTAPGSYTVLANSTWLNPDGTTDATGDTITVDVLENPVQRVSPDAINGSVGTAAQDKIGNFTVFSEGNFNISNAAFTCESGTVCQNMSVSFDPINISTLREGENRTVNVTVSVPARFPAGNYTGTVNVSSTGGQDNVTLNVEVPITRSWTLEPATCQTSSSPAVGTVCRPVVNNTGNADLNITISPSAVNNTNVTPSNFSVPFGTSSQFNATYNVTGVQDQVHNATYNVSAVEDASPQWESLQVSVLPAVDPRIAINITPRVFDQGETTSVLANITMTSGFAADDIHSTFRPPENTVQEADMRRVKNYTGAASNTALWQLFYPNATALSGANTSTRGTYTVNITANDTLGNDAFNTSRFNVTAALTPRLSTLSSTYVQGDRGDINYSLIGFFNQPIGNASVDLFVRDPTAGFVNLLEDNPYTTKSGGQKAGFLMTKDDGRPTFELSSDAPTGIYDVVANASWDDPVTGATERPNASTTFAVEQPGDFTVNWDAGSVWKKKANFTVRVAVSKGGALDDADNVNLTVYDPSDNVFFTINDSAVIRQQKGLYKAVRNLSAGGTDPALGTYWAKLVVEDEGSMAVKFQSFRVATEAVATGPFDINVSITSEDLENGVEQDSYVDFNISLLNPDIEDADDSGDSKVTYYVTDAGNGTEYSYVSETIYTPDGKRITIARNLYVFDDQSTGKYFVKAEVEPLDSSIPPATAAQSFRVVAKNETEQPDPIVREETETRQAQPPPPEEEPPEPKTPNVTIVDAPAEVNLVRGRSLIKPVTVANNGETTLNNVSLNVVGVPPSWISVSPSEIGTMDVATTETFAVTYTPPASAPLQEYNATFLVTSDTATGRQRVRVQVFQSLEEKIRADIERIRGELGRLKSQIETLREKGVDVSGAEDLVTEIETNLENAEQKLSDGNPSAALQDVSEADSLLTETEGVVKKLKAPERDQALSLIPLIIGGVILVAVLLTGVYFIRVRQVEPLGAVRERVRRISLDMKRRKHEEREALLEQKRKTKRLIELLEAQHKEGIMGDESYQELKSSAEEKLKRINRKLEED